MGIGLVRKVLVGGVAVAVPAHAAFTLVDNFNHKAIDSQISGQNSALGKPWLGPAEPALTIKRDPLNPSNKMLQFLTPNHAAHKAIPTVANNTTGTIFFRIYKQAPSGTVNYTGVSAGVTSVTEGLNIDKIGEAGLTERFGTEDAGTQERLLLNTFESSVANSFWLVINSAINTYRTYIQGSPFANQTVACVATVAPTPGTVGATTVPFSTGSPAEGNQDITKFVARQLSAFGSTRPWFLDDIYVDNAGANLANPNPEPASVAALALMTGGLAARRRRA